VLVPLWMNSFADREIAHRKIQQKWHERHTEKECVFDPPKEHTCEVQTELRILSTATGVIGQLSHVVQKHAEEEKRFAHDHVIIQLQSIRVVTVKEMQELNWIATQ